jgi:hypothetical protein
MGRETMKEGTEMNKNQRKREKDKERKYEKKNK